MGTITVNSDYEAINGGYSCTMWDFTEKPSDYDTSKIVRVELSYIPTWEESDIYGDDTIKVSCGVQNVAKPCWWEIILGWGETDDSDGKIGLYYNDQTISSDDKSCTLSELNELFNNGRLGNGVNMLEALVATTENQNLMFEDWACNQSFLDKMAKAIKLYFKY